MLQARHAVNFQLTVERPFEKDTNAMPSASMYNKCAEIATVQDCVLQHAWASAYEKDFPFKFSSIQLYHLHGLRTQN